MEDNYQLENFDENEDYDNIKEIDKQPGSVFTTHASRLIKLNPGAKIIITKNAEELFQLQLKMRRKK